MADHEDSGDRGRVSPAVALVVVLVVGAVGGVAFAQSATDGPSGKSILENAHEKYRSAETLTGSADITVSNATEERSATVEYALAESKGVRLSVTHNGTTIAAGTNGSVAWLSAPKAGVQRTWSVENESSWDAGEVCEAVRDEAGEFELTNRTDLPDAVNASAVRANVSAMQANVSSVDCESLTANWTDAKRSAPANWSEANLTATRTGTTTLDGTEAYVVAIKHENESVDVNGTVWVAVEDSRIIKHRVTHGANATVVRYDDQRFNVTIHESTFAPPSTRSGAAGTTTYDSFSAVEDATDRDLPTLDADAFAFEGAAVTNAGGGTTVAQRYADGSTTVTLLTTDAESLPYGELNGSTVTVNGHDATAATIQGRTIVAWTTDGVTHAVVSEGTTDETVALAETVAE